MPVPKLRVVSFMRSMKVELLEGSNWIWLAHAAPHLVPVRWVCVRWSRRDGERGQDALEISRSKLPVSNTTFMVCGGVPTGRESVIRIHSVTNVNIKRSYL